MPNAVGAVGLYWN